MTLTPTTRWARIGLLNLLLVALYGLLMRYKIAFAFPYFNQRNLLHAHSHFAFAGWVSLLLMALIVNAFENNFTDKVKQQFNITLWSFLACSWGMLISFTIQGYGEVSIFFATTSVIVSFVYCWLYYKNTKHLKGIQAKRWFNAALIFNLISTLGTFYLSYMMATKNIGQHNYLATIYWYLHFQYNGWFLFACIGLLVHYLQTKGIVVIAFKKVFFLLVISCVPAYGLSVLWLKIPLAVLLLIGLAAILQFTGAVKLLLLAGSKKISKPLGLSKLAMIMLLFSGVAFFIKFALQLGSTIPWVSQLAFGFRPIVIAYLHLVLLAFTSIFILAYLYMNNFISQSRIMIAGIITFLAGVFLNELILGIQGIASFSYTYIPYINEALVIASVILVAGALFMSVGYKKRTL